jgi:hypothetical protein
MKQREESPFEKGETGGFDFEFCCNRGARVAACRQFIDGLKS